MIRTFNFLHTDKQYIDDDTIGRGIDVTARAMAACAYVKCLEDSNVPSSPHQREDARKWASRELRQLRRLSEAVADAVAVEEGLSCEEYAVAVDFVCGNVLFCDGEHAESLAKNYNAKSALLTSSLDKELKHARGYGIAPPEDIDVQERAEIAALEPEIDKLDEYLEKLHTNSGLPKWRAKRTDEVGQRLTQLLDRRLQLEKTARKKKREWVLKRYWQEVYGR